MSGKIVVTMKLAPGLHNMFITEAAADGRYIDRGRQPRNYDDFVRRKVEIARMEWDAGSAHRLSEACGWACT
ncbi:hypothetical protein P7L74_00785 (plasmid) [Tistrella mobilis]